MTKSSPDCKETLESLLESIVPFLNFGFLQKKSQSALHLMIFLGFTFLKMQSAVNENGRQNKFPLGANRVRCRIFNKPTWCINWIILAFMDLIMRHNSPPGGPRWSFVFK